MTYIDADFSKLSDDAALGEPLAALDDAPAAVGWTALPPAFSDEPLPGLGCWERWGPGHAWRRISRLDWIVSRLVGVGGEYVRRTRA